MWSTKATRAKRHKIAVSKSPNKDNANKTNRKRKRIRKKISNPKKTEIIQQKSQKHSRTDIAIADQISAYWPSIQYKRVIPTVVSVLELKYFDTDDDEMKIKILDEIITQIYTCVFKISRNHIINHNYFVSISVDTIYSIYSYLEGSDLISMIHLNKEHYKLLSHKNSCRIWKTLCTLHEFTKHTEREGKWKGLAWKQRFIDAYLRRDNFVYFVRNTLQKKGFDVESLYAPPLSMKKIRKFETKYNCRLPKDYVLFINTLGNGGAGPSYGCPGILNNQTYDAGNTCCMWDEWERYKYLKYKYPYTDTAFRWGYYKDGKRIGYTVDEKKQNVYDVTDVTMRGKNKIKKKNQGTICVSLNGCGYEMFLVVNGKDKGMVYDDGMAADGGYSKVCGFLTWYEEWVKRLGDVDDQMSQICAPYWYEVVYGCMISLSETYEIVADQFIVCIQL